MKIKCSQSSTLTKRYQFVGHQFLIGFIFSKLYALMSNSISLEQVCHNCTLLLTRSKQNTTHCKQNKGGETTTAAISSSYSAGKMHHIVLLFMNSCPFYIAGIPNTDCVKLHRIPNSIQGVNYARQREKSGQSPSLVILFAHFLNIRCICLGRS